MKDRDVKKASGRLVEFLVWGWVFLIYIYYFNTAFRQLPPSLSPANAKKILRHIFN